jgi:K+-sensing histidine kinase KdpD
VHHVVQLPLSGQNREVIWKIPDNLPPAWVDEISIEKVIYNLVSNAHKYSPIDKPIEISAKIVNSEDIGLIINVFGPGIAEDMQAEIFEKFQRLEQSNFLVSKGWGLGLYFAKILANAQNCKIDIQSPVRDSAEMPGSAFILTLPVKSEGNEDGSYIDN